MNDEVDIRKATQAKSDQLNSDDLLAGTITGAVTGVRSGSKEQPVQIDLNCWHVPFKPCKSMIRILAACWGDNARDWVGRSMTLFNDPEVVYGGIKVGGIRISHLSHIESDMTISLTKTRGKKAPHIVKRIGEQKAPPVEMYPADKFEANFQAWADLIASGKKTAEQIITNVERGGKLTVGQADRIQAVKLAEPIDAPQPLEDGDPFDA